MGRPRVECRALFYHRHAFNDLVVLNVQRSRGGAFSTCGGSYSSSSCKSTGTAALPSSSSSSSGRLNPSRRRRHSKGKHPVFDSQESDSDDGSEADGVAGEQGEESSSSSSSNGYSYRWVRPMVRGTPPVGRLAHSAAVARLVEGEAGSGGVQQTYMVVFGGVGTSSHFNDVHCLK